MNRSRLIVVSVAAALALTGTGQGLATSASSASQTIAPRVAPTPNGTWSSVGASPDGAVFALTRDSAGSLYVGGDFDSIGGQSLTNVARWSGATYAPLGAGLDDTVRALAWDDTLYIGGQFDSEVSGVAGSLAGIAAWAQRGGDDTYVPLGAGVVTSGGQPPTRSVRVILPTDDTVYIGGEFASASSVANTSRLAGWVDDTWVNVGGGIPTSCALAERVVSLADLPTQGLFVGGKFRCAGAASPEDDTNISLWDGSQWNNLDGGLTAADPSTSDIVAAMAVDDDTLYVGGSFATAGPSASPIAASSLALWNGTTWASIGNGVTGICGAADISPEVAALNLDADRGLLYAAGGFCRAGDDTVNSIVVRDLAVDQWVPLVAPGSVVGLTGSDATSYVFSLARDDSVLYVGGRFAAAGGGSGPSNLARWTWGPPTGSNAVSASPGQSISISGSGFIGVPASGGVYIGGVPSPSYVRTSTSTFSNVVVPSGISGTVTIEVDAVGGRAPVGTLTVPTPIPAGPPRDVVAVAGDRSASISWAAPASTGSFPVTNYQVTSTPGGRVCLTTGLSCTVSGLTNGTAYTFTVKALTGAGWGPSSASSNAVTPQAEAKPTVTITGSREGRKVVISGTSTGLGMGAILKPWLRRAGESTFTERKAEILVSMDGTFTWQVNSRKKVSVYVTTSDGVRSNMVTIRSRA